jgi:AcrR family transcriptional regulator
MPATAPLVPARPKKRGRPHKGEGGKLRDELISRSAQLFREKGYDNTTVRDIAAATGIQAGSWFYHFKTKHDILAAIMEQGMERSLAETEAIAALDLPPRAMLHQLVEVHLHTLLAPDHHFIAVLLYEWRSLDDGPHRGAEGPLRSSVGQGDRGAAPVWRLGHAVAIRPAADLRCAELDRAMVQAGQRRRRPGTGAPGGAVHPAHATATQPARGLEYAHP